MRDKKQTSGHFKLSTDADIDSLEMLDVYAMRWSIETFDFLGFTHFYLTKAKEQLGYQPTSIRDEFHETYAFHYHRRLVIANPLAIIPLDLT